MYLQPIEPPDPHTLRGRGERILYSTSALRFGSEQRHDDARGEAQDRVVEHRAGAKPGAFLQCSFGREFRM